MLKIISDKLVHLEDGATANIKTGILKDIQFQEELFLLLEIENDQDNFLKIIYPLISDTFKNIFFNKENETLPENKFEQALKEINQQCIDMQQSHNKKIQINAIIAAITKDNHLILTQSGKAEAYLIRQNKLNVISDNSGDFQREDQDVFASIASGDITHEDRILFSSSRLLRLLTASQLVTIFKDGVSEGLQQIKDVAGANEEKFLGVISMHLKTPIVIPVRHTESISTPSTRLRDEKIVEPVLAQTKYYDVTTAVSVQEILKNMFEKSIHFIKKKTEGISRKGLILGIFTVAVVLIVGIAIINKQNEAESLRNTDKQHIASIREEITKAQNLHLKGEQTAAMAVLDQASSDLKDILNSGTFRTEAIALTDQITETKKQVNNIVQVKSVNKMANLAEKRPLVEALGMTSFENTLYVYDLNALYKTILNVVESPVTIPEEIIDAKAMSDKNQIVFYTRNGKIIEYSDGEFSIADTQDDTWAQAIDLEVFRKNVYLLDKTSNQIWKYERRNTVYTGKRGYIQDESVDIRDAISFAIDGYVYILKENREIMVLYSGKPIDFEIRNLPEGTLDNVSKIFTTQDLNNLYLLDSVSNRVIVIQKGENPEYKEQYIIEDIPSIVDIYIDPAEQNMYLLDKQSIYSLTL